MCFKQIILIIAFCFISLYSICQNSSLSVDNRIISNGYSSNNYLWNFYKNPSGISGIKNITAGISYSNNYMINSLGTKKAIICYPFHNTIIVTGISSFGCDLYKINEFNIGCAKSLTDNFSTGIKLNYQYDRFIDKQLPSTSILNFEIGMNANINKNLNIAASIHNPMTIRINDDNNTNYSAIIKAEIEYVYNQKTRLFILSTKDIAYKPSFETGLEYLLNNKIQLFSSFKPQPFAHTIGFRLYLKSSKIDISFKRHIILGFSSSIGISFFKI